MKCVIRLIVAGADVNTRLNTGATALCVAAQNGFEQCVLTLIDEGADVNAGTPEGVNPLALAVHYEQSVCREILLRAGADSNTAAITGATSRITGLRTLPDISKEEIDSMDEDLLSSETDDSS